MKFTTISLLTFPLAIFADSCNPTKCFCQLWVGGIALQGNIPAGTGSIQSEMRIQNRTGYCSVVLNRGQGCCDQYTQTSTPTGLGCPQVFGALICGESIPYTTHNASTTPSTTAPSTTAPSTTAPSTIAPSTTTTTVFDTTTATVTRNATTTVSNTTTATVTRNATITVSDTTTATITRNATTTVSDTTTATVTKDATTTVSNTTTATVTRNATTTVFDTTTATVTKDATTTVSNTTTATVTRNATTTVSDITTITVTRDATTTVSDTTTATVTSAATTTVLDTTTATVTSAATTTVLDTTTTTATTTISLQPTPSSYDLAFCNPPVAIGGSTTQDIWTPICGYSYYGQSDYKWAYWTYGSDIECLQACDADSSCSMMSYDTQYDVNNCYVILDNAWCYDTANFPPMYADYNQNSAYNQCC